MIGYWLLQIMTDLTIIYLTANRVPEKWAEYQRSVLLEASDGAPILSLSRLPVSLGTNVVYTEIEGISNIYRQMLKGAIMASTPFIAIAEDDTLYPKEHFECFRPPMDTFAYNMNRAGIFTWAKVPTYYWKTRFVNAVLISPRQLMIDALEERFKKYPKGMPINGELGRSNIEGKLGVSIRKSITFLSEISVVRFDHDFGGDGSARRHTKRMGEVKAFDIPYWHRAEDLRAKFI